MFLKITLIAIVALVGSSDAAQVWDGFTAKWAANVTDGWFQLPTTLYAAWSDGWTRLTGVDPPEGHLALSYRNDSRFVLIFSTRTGKVAGHQVGIPVVDIDLSQVPDYYYRRNSGFTRRLLNGEAYFTATAMYHEDANGSNRRIWLERDGQFEEMPTRSDLLLTDSPYYAKRCIPEMGQHFYQINSTSSVADRYPWFLLVIGKEVIGIGFQSYGSVRSAPERVWFETIPLTQIRRTIPDISAAGFEAVATDGLISLHVWFRKNPRGIQCLDQCTAVYNETQDFSSHGYLVNRRRRALGPANVC